MKFLNIKLSVKNNIILYTTIFLALVWYLIFGFNLINEPYVWDDLHFFRKYSNEELKDWWKDILPILDYNQRRFLEFGKGKTKKVKLLERLYD